nr:hypothetical protein BaRGS_018371 [Batillaria attramentaria]
MGKAVAMTGTRNQNKQGSTPRTGGGGRRNMHGRTPTELAQTHEMRAVLQEPVIHKQTVTNMPEPEDMADFLPLCFLGTQLNRDQRSQLQKCATKLHAKVVDEYCCEVTHLVSWCNGDGQCPRTFKYLQAVLDGKWIVTIDWVNVCLEYGEKVSEEPFEIPGTNLQPNSNAPHKARLNRRQQVDVMNLQTVIRSARGQLQPDARLTLTLVMPR